MAKGKYEKWLEPDGLLLLQSWARDGLTDEQIAGNMGISHTTLYEWRKKYPNISEALKKGKEVVDVEVENALYKRAIGYDYEKPQRNRVKMDIRNGLSKSICPGHDGVHLLAKKQKAA